MVRKSSTYTLFQVSDKNLLCTGFDLSAMATELYDEAIVDVVGPEALLSKPYPVKVIHVLYQ